MSTKSFKNTEILYVIDAIAREKSINTDDLFFALEEVIKATTKAQYGNVENICVRMDKKTGNVDLYRAIKVVSDEDFEEAEGACLIRKGVCQLKATSWY
jgi:N utilization substance protein A